MSNMHNKRLAEIYAEYTKMAAANPDLVGEQMGVWMAHKDDILDVDLATQATCGDYVMRTFCAENDPKLLFLLGNQMLSEVPWARAYNANMIGNYANVILALEKHEGQRLLYEKLRDTLKQYIDEVRPTTK